MLSLSLKRLKACGGGECIMYYGMVVKTVGQKQRPLHDLSVFFSGFARLENVLKVFLFFFLLHGAVRKTGASILVARLHVSPSVLPSPSFFLSASLIARHLS